MLKRIIISLIVIIGGLVQGTYVFGQTIHFDPNGGTGTMQDLSGSLITLPQCSFGAFNPGTDATTKHTFYKWNTKADGSGTDYAAGAQVQFVENTTLYAQWFIFFDFNAGSISLNNNSYTGYVYVNGTATKLTGKHNNNSKYYIYQTCATETSPQYHIGYANKTDFDNRVNINVPVYPSIQWEEKSWGDFITNNTDVPSVLDNWPTAAKNSGRTATNDKRITINASNSNATYNIVIADLWSSYEHNVSHSTNAAINIGGYGSTGSHSFPNHEKVNLKVKGDNRFYSILYAQKIGLDGYLNVTSIKGDGSDVGSLTVGPSSSSIALDDAMTVFGSADDDNSEPCYGLEFNGATIFVSDTPHKNTPPHCVLGGGTNNKGYITVTGGRVTAISYSTGAAIGGGGGYHSNGADGYVNISGGEVFAYHFGAQVYNNKMSCAAIGGGSSLKQIGNTGYVTISGGEVYAQSIGGVAIGGGSSFEQDGGSSEFTMTGGTVIAKSLPGNIAGLDVLAGTGIGGGTGYNIGGNSIINISGADARLVTASVGGGQHTNPGGEVGKADVNILDGDIQAQFIMQASSSSYCTFNMEGGTIHKSSSESSEYVLVQKDGGALWINDPKGVVNISGGTIENCTAHNGGAVFQTGGTFTLSGNAVIEGNTALANGGALCISGGTTKILSTNAKIIDNESKAQGGGLYVSGGKVTFSSGRLTDNTAVNGGGLFLASGASMEFTGGIIKNNHAKAPEDYSGPYTAYAGTVGAKGFGGGFYIQKGESTPSTLTINIASGADFGIYDNDATTGADDILAEGNNTSINIPNVKDMQLAEFSASAYPNWYEDYHAGDANYSKGLNQHPGCTTYDRFVNMLNDAAHYANHRYLADGTAIANKYLNLKLGYESLRIIISATGLNEKETAYYQLIHHEEGGGEVSYPVLLLGDGSSKVSKSITGLPWGNYSAILDKKWTWAYDVTVPNADGRYENIPIVGETEYEFPFTVEHKSGDKNVLHDEEIIKNLMLGK